MLTPLFLATTLPAPAPVSARTVRRSSAVSLPFTITIPPIPSFGTTTLPARRSRSLIPLTPTLTLDPEQEAAREEQDLVRAINTERTARGLEPLLPDPVLNEAARAHSQEMCRLNYFAHRSPTHGDETPVDRYLDELHADGADRPARALVGENIFYASVTSDFYGVSYAHRSLMASASHRENILEPRFTKVGVGLYRDPGGRFWVTEMFLRDS